MSSPWLGPEKGFSECDLRLSGSAPEDESENPKSRFGDTERWECWGRALREAVVEGTFDMAEDVFRGSHVENGGVLGCTR